MQERLLRSRRRPRTQLIAEAEDASTWPGPARALRAAAGSGPLRLRSRQRLAAHAERRGVSAGRGLHRAGAGDRRRLVVCNYPFLNQGLEAVEEMLDDPLVTLGLADAGAHVGQIMDASQPTFFLTYWIGAGPLELEEAIRRLTSDTAELFGIVDRGVLRPGAFADVNVIDLDDLTLHQPEFVHDFPGGAGRYVQGGTGYALLVVNGQVFMDHGEHTGVLRGSVAPLDGLSRPLRSPGRSSGGRQGVCHDHRGHHHARRRARGRWSCSAASVRRSGRRRATAPVGACRTSPPTWRRCSRRSPTRARWRAPAAPTWKPTPRCRWALGGAGRAPEVLADYEEWATRPRRPRRPAGSGAATTVVPLANLGSHPLHLLANALVFDHYCHLR